MKNIAFAFGGVVLAALPAAAQNPFVTSDYYADPSAHVWNGRLYVYPSHDIDPPRGCDLMDKYHVFSTDDLVIWTDHGEIFGAKDVPWGRPEGGFMWAPDCAYRDGVYYYYFPHPSETRWNDTWRIGVATSRYPDRDFKVSEKWIDGLGGFAMIDPCVFTDDDGVSYIYCGGGQKAVGARLKDNMVELAEPARPMEGLVDFHEGAWVFKRNGIYYFMYPDNYEEVIRDATGKEHRRGANRQHYATSTSPLGPWTHRGIILDPTGCDTSHGSVVEFKGEWYLFYHNCSVSGRGNLRSICVDRLTFNEDGTINKVVQTVTGPAPVFTTTTFDVPWQDRSAEVQEAAPSVAAIELDPARVDQSVLGFGVCMSELSKDSLWLLPEEERRKVFDEIYSPVGGGFTVLRTPIGASDFARDFYSYAETPGDYAMKKFSIARDESGLLPLIREAQRRVRPDVLRIWASPWCPPAWMKTNGKAESRPDKVNDLTPEERIFEGEDGFICDDAHFKAYALYFRKYVEAYRRAGVPIWMVMPQNEFNSDQNFPSCTWSAGQLCRFTGDYLGPALEDTGVELFLGTMERPNPSLLEPALSRPTRARYVTGTAFQWAGRAAIREVRRRHPDLMYVMSEQECGDGRNDWRHAMHCWDLMKFYFDSGVSVYDYWNLSLTKDGLSHWGWRQNSLVVVDAQTRAWRFTPEYYVLKQVSRFVRRGAKRLVPQGGYENVLAFLNPDGTVVTAFGNPDATPVTVAVRIGGKAKEVTLPPASVSTLVLP